MEDLVRCNETECIIVKGCPLELQEVACLESAWCMGVKVEPLNPEYMDELGFRVILALEVVSRMEGCDMEDSNDLRVQVRMGCTVRCEHHDVQVGAQVD